MSPQGVRANSWRDVADLSARAGVVLDGWQELILESSMGERSDATWAAKRVGISVPRQNGKSQLLVSRALAGALLFGERKIVISAHQQDTARESFGKLLEIIEADANGWLRSRIRPGGIMQAINRESVKFTTGATIQFKARTQSGGRGFSSDCLMLDEAQRLDRRAWVSINSTMSAMPNPQVWLLGTPPTPEDKGEVFGSVRQAAISGLSTASAWLEWAADPDADDFDPASEYTRWSANPAWNVRINHEIVQGEFESYTAEEFAQDRLGIWGEALRTDGVISPPQWSGCLAPDAEITSRPTVAIDVSPMLTHTGIVAAGKTADGRVGVEVTSDGETLIDYREGTEWAVELLTRNRAHVWMAAGSAAETLADRLVAGGCRVDVMSRTDYAKACVNFAAMVAQKRLVHRGQSELDKHVTVGAKRSADEGLWTWGRIKSSSDITLLVAATVAAGALHSTPEYDVLKTIL